LLDVISTQCLKIFDVEYLVMMSFVDRLFPQAELEALGNKWHEPAPKRRKLGPGPAQAVKAASGPQRKGSSDAGPEHRRHRLSTPTPYLYGRQQSSTEYTHARNAKRSNSDSQALASAATSTLIQGKSAGANKSCLPDFIEPSILKNYLRHLHPKDSPRYTVPVSPSTGSHDTEETVSSPASLVPDSTPSPASTDNCPTPAAVCERFRSGPFGHLFDGMRLTDNERDLMEDLLSPIPEPSQDEASSQKRKYDEIQVGLAPDDYFAMGETLLDRMFPAFTSKDSHGLGIELTDPTKTELDCDGYSLGLSTAANEREGEGQATSHRGIVVYDYDALSVDDFFDLDEAST